MFVFLCGSIDIDKQCHSNNNKRHIASIHITQHLDGDGDRDGF